MRKLSVVLGFVALSLSVVGCKNDESEPPVKPHHLGAGQPQFQKQGELSFLNVEGTVLSKINIEIADTPDRQQKGLMNRSFMSNDNGMLFIFDVERPQSFWMRNTIIPLDIIYVNSKMQIVSIAKNTTPYSEESIPSRGPAIYVVEVNGGYCDQYSIQPGCLIQFTKL
ncbi:MAG TPA: DUF192 domain-containing protein [Chitinophagales bacterium]|nr:DUF192 domain-containing protein [Chitinophagales bacterium]